MKPKKRPTVDFGAAEPPRDGLTPLGEPPEAAPDLDLEISQVPEFPPEPAAESLSAAMTDPEAGASPAVFEPAATRAPVIPSAAADDCGAAGRPGPLASFT